MVRRVVPPTQKSAAFGIDDPRPTLPDFPPMPRLYALDSGETILKITERQLTFLVDTLEEEHDEDRDYFISRDTLDFLKEEGCDDELYEALEEALGDEDELDIAWES